MVRLLMMYSKSAAMLAYFVQKTPTIILDKMNNLLGALSSVKEAYEHTAQSTSNRSLKFSILEIVQESRQYANELIAHIETLGGQFDASYKKDTNRLPYPAFQPAGSGDIYSINNLLYGEQFIVGLYRDILNEPFLYEHIRKMIRYQLNGMMHAFAQLKLLKSSVI